MSAGRRGGPVLAWTALFAGGLLLAALVAPWAYRAVLAVVPDAGWPFSRIFNRTAMAIALVLLVLLRRSIGWRSVPALFAARTARQAGAELAVGFGGALLATALAVAGAVALGLLARAEPFYTFTFGRIAAGLAGALIAALIEETFFRGMMLASLTVSLGQGAAVLVSSGAYSLVHLLVSDPSFGRQGLPANAGLVYLRHTIARQVEPASLLPLFGLFLCGLVLAAVVRRSLAIYLAIGLHTGWAFAFPMLRHATKPLVAIPGHSYLATHHYLVGAWWAWIGILAAGALVYGWSARREAAVARRSEPAS